MVLRFEVSTLVWGRGRQEEEEEALRDLERREGEEEEVGHGDLDNEDEEESETEDGDAEEEDQEDRDQDLDQDDEESPEPILNSYGRQALGCLFGMANMPTMCASYPLANEQSWADFWYSRQDKGGVAGEALARKLEVRYAEEKEGEGEGDREKENASLRQDEDGWRIASSKSQVRGVCLLMASSRKSYCPSLEWMIEVLREEVWMDGSLLCVARVRVSSSRGGWSVRSLWWSRPRAARASSPKAKPAPRSTRAG